MRNGQIVYYAFVDGHGKPEFVGTLEEVEVALGLRQPAPAVLADSNKGKTWDVTLSFQFPAWDEVNGILYPGITASSKSDAISQARRQARDDGHTGGGKGRYWFSARESD